MNRLVYNCGSLWWLALFLLLSASFTTADDDFHIERVSEPGPWSGVSGLIGYQNRVWFVNSVKFVNHNSADLYSYDPETGRTRYEAHLFSQDAGDPVVFKGLLYWPFEDPRFSSGRGEYMVTNGREWSWHDIPSGEAFHLHAMAGSGEALYAATSAWRAGIHLSTDLGISWRRIYDHPTPDGRVSRITSLTTAGDRVYAGLLDRSSIGRRLLVLNNGLVSALAGAPQGRRATSLAFHQGWLYGEVADGAERTFWRKADQGQVIDGLNGRRVSAMASSESGLWAVTIEGEDGDLWHSDAGRRWRRVHQFHQAMPLDVLAYRGNVYVGTYTADGKGGLWGTNRSPVAREMIARRPLPGSPGREEPSASDVADLESALVDDAEFKRYRMRLLEVLTELSRKGSAAAGHIISKKLVDTLPAGSVRAFGGQYEVEKSRASRWYLLRATGMTGHGKIPLRFLKQPWDERENPAAKYFHATPAAAWAVARTGQNDIDTLQALIDGLDLEPDWLAGGFVGALSEITGERYGYDVEAWRHWWARYADMLPVPAGSLRMGSTEGDASEQPIHTVHLHRFYLDRHEVTNEAFTEFVRSQSYVTDPEKKGWGWHWDGRWYRVEGADWRHPRGPGSGIEGLSGHPVVQVSWHDARAYCAWRDKRLPSEAEWERAARAEGNRQYAWGDAPPLSEEGYRASFGAVDCCRTDPGDGFMHTAPVGSFDRGRGFFGHHDLTGNVWEWVEDSFDQHFYARSTDDNPVNRNQTRSRVIRGGGWGNNPWGLRATLRHANPPHYGLSMVGFRCARSAISVESDS